jgi:hypothetical protein
MKNRHGQHLQHGRHAEKQEAAEGAKPAPAPLRINVPGLRRREKATARNPLPSAATNGFRPRNVSPTATAAARAHGCMA